MYYTPFTLTCAYAHTHTRYTHLFVLRCSYTHCMHLFVLQVGKGRELGKNKFLTYNETGRGGSPLNLNYVRIGFGDGDDGYFKFEYNRQGMF